MVECLDSGQGHAGMTGQHTSALVAGVTRLGEGTRHWTGVGDMGYQQFRRDELLALGKRQSPVYVFNDEALNECFFDLQSLEGVSSVLYPVHANPHPNILGKAVEQGLGFRCTAIREMDLLQGSFPRLDPKRIVFFPAESNPEEIVLALGREAYVGLNDPNALRRWPDLWRNQRIFIPLDMADSQGLITSINIYAERLLGELTQDVLPPDDAGRPSAAFHRALNASPQASILILGDVGGETMMDIRALSEGVETLSQIYPEKRIWLIIPDEMIARTGGLILRIAHVTEQSGVRRIRVHGGMLPLCSGNRWSSTHKIINLTRPDSGSIPLPGRITTLSDDETTWIELPDTPAVLQKDDILMLTHMGAPGTRRISVQMDRDNIPQHYLRARPMCPVRI